MVRGDRVDSVEYARRVNAAADLAGAGTPVAAAARTLASRYGVSVRQARRYLEQAVAVGRVEVPESSVVFTVKLPGSLAGQIRARAQESDRAISAVVAQALAEFLERGGSEGRPHR
jgi:DNA-binding transcriptional regulator LsrR (DeoR family)